MVIDGLAVSKTAQQVYLPAACYVLLYGVMAVNFRGLDWLKYKTFPSLNKDTTLKMFDYIKQHSHTFFQNNFSGSVSNKINDMVVNLEALLNSADEFFANFIALLIATVVMYAVSPIFAIALFGWCLIFFMVSLVFSGRIYRLSKQTSEAYSKYAGMLVDVFTNIASVRMFARFKYETDKLGGSLDSLVCSERSMLGYIISMRLVQDVTFVTLVGSMFYILLNLYAKNAVTLGDFALILTITMSIFQSMWQLANRISDVYKNIGKCLQAMSLLELQHEIVDINNATDLIVKNGKIEFKDVTFAYENSAPIFVRQSITITAGSKVGLVGYSGSGKSTFINLILRLYDIDSGSISIDEQDIKQMTQDSLRRNISMIPQDISLFHRSLMDNIRYGNVAATESEVVAASNQAHCHPER
jgi:ATP-binding cassette subfamily B protein